MNITRQIFRARGPIAAATIAVAALSFSSAGAMAAGLFDSLPAGESANFGAAPAAPENIRDRLVRLDLGYMETNLAPTDADTARDRLRNLPDAPVRVELFNDIDVTLVRTDVDKAFGKQGGYIWSGKIRGDKIGYALLVISGGQLTGQIMSAGRLFQISPVEGSVHRITEIDESKYPGDIAIPAPRSGDDTSGDTSEATNPEGKTKVKVLMPFTQAAKAAVGNIGAAANQAIGLANQSLKNGGVKMKYVLAATMVIKNYVESSFTNDLAALKAGAGDFARVHNKRNKKKADIVAMLRKPDPGGLICGLGYVNVNPVPSDATNAFSVTATNCITNQSTTHEIGHNDGLFHDRYQHVVNEGNPKPPKSQINFGYANLKALVRSVMAYNNVCVAKKGVSCTRVPMHSSSKRKWNSTVKLGIAKNKKNAADASAQLNINRTNIAKFR